MLSRSHRAQMSKSSHCELFARVGFAVPMCRPQQPMSAPQPGGLHLMLFHADHIRVDRPLPYEEFEPSCAVSLSAPSNFDTSDNAAAQKSRALTPSHPGLKSGNHLRSLLSQIQPSRHPVSHKSPLASIVVPQNVILYFPVDIGFRRWWLPLQFVRRPHCTQEDAKRSQRHGMH